jgi:Spy/CpxP family protein refolding chaperone
VTSLALLLAGAAVSLTQAPAHDNHAAHLANGARHSNAALGGAHAGFTAEEANQLRAGAGLGFATAAERNGYPGPRHVLDLATALRLTPAQEQRARSLFLAMKTEAIPLGETLIAQEAALNQLFATPAVDPEKLAAATRAVGLTSAALRAVHLRHHLAMKEALTPDQVRRYTELRAGAH